MEKFIPEKKVVKGAKGSFEPGPNMLDTAKDYLVEKVNYGAE